MFAVVSRGFAHHFFEHFGEKQLIRIAHRAGNITNRQTRIQGQFGCSAHPVMDQIRLNAASI